MKLVLPLSLSLYGIELFLKIIELKQEVDLKSSSYLIMTKKSVFTNLQWFWTVMVVVPRN